MTNEDTKGEDASEVLTRPITKAEALGKRPPIPVGTYEDCTVNIKGAKRYKNNDGSVNVVIETQFSCPTYDGDLSHGFSLKWGPKAPWGRLVRACFPGDPEQAVEGRTPVECNGKRVTMMVTPDVYNGKPSLQFTFMPPKASPAPKK